MANAKQKMKKTSGTGKRVQITKKIVEDAFFACPRCSHFLAGYRLIHDDLDDAAENCNGQWLDLTWNWATRNLLYKVYGVQLDQDLSMYLGVCKSCYRSFQVEEPVEITDESSEPSTSFLIQLYPA